MENCRVTEFKGRAENNNLPLFDTIVLHILPVETPSTGNRDLFFTGATGVVKNIVSGIGCIYANWNPDFSVDSGVKEHVFNNSNNYVSNGEYTLEIQNKYATTKIENNTLPIPFTEFEWLTKVTYINCTANTSSNSNIEVLDKLILLETLNLRYNNANGEITTLAASQVANGRTSGTLAITSGGHIKLNGANVPNQTVKTIKFGSSMVDPTEAEITQGYQVV